MTAQEYRTAGYRVSLQVSQQEITRAENDVTSAYVAAVNPQFSANDTKVKSAVMQLAFILLCQRSTVDTRSGGKVKTSPSLSETGYPSQSDFENADRLLSAVAVTGCRVSEAVDDICGIYYRKKFIGL